MIYFKFETKKVWVKRILIIQYKPRKISY